MHLTHVDLVCDLFYVARKFLSAVQEVFPYYDPLGQEPVTGRYPESNEFRFYCRKIII
jgi:hypothetical protein